MKADKLYLGDIITMDDIKPSAEAIAVKDGLIQYVGSEAIARSLCDENTEIIDLKGNTIYPGFLEAHCHPIGAGAKLDKGIIPCRVADYYDIISSYSVEGCETLNPAFREYLDENISYIPSAYPVVVEITGKAFTPQEQERLRTAIREDAIYELGDAESERRDNLRLLLYVMLGTILGTGLLIFANTLTDVAKEFFYVIYWFFADTLVRFLLYGRFDPRYRRLLAGRKASMAVRFSEVHGENPITDEEAKALMQEMLSYKEAEIK